MMVFLKIFHWPKNLEIFHVWKKYFLPLALFRHVCYIVIILHLNVLEEHLTSNKQLHVFNISTLLNFAPRPHGA